jgi:hypothetical protein
MEKDTMNIAMIVHLFAAIAAVVMIWAHVNPVIDDYRNMTDAQTRALIELTIGSE